MEGPAASLPAHNCTTLSNQRRKRRERTAPEKAVFALAILLLLVGVANLGRATVALYTASRLPDLPVSVPLPYLAATSAFRGAALIACAVGLVRFRRWARWATLIVATLFQAQVWLDHLLFDRSHYALRIWPRDLALSALFLALVWGLLNWPSIRKVFEE